MREQGLIEAELRDAIEQSADIIDEKALHLHGTASNLRSAMKSIENSSVQSDMPRIVREFTSASTQYQIIDMRHQEVNMKLMRLLIELEQTLPEKKS